MTVQGYQLRISYKNPCRIASTANLGLSGLAAIDGVTPVAGDRVLVKDQTAGGQNGIYVAASGAWSRALDMDDVADDNISAGLSVYIQEGTANAQRTYTLTTTGTIVLNTTALTFADSGTAETGNYLPYIKDGTPKTATFTAVLGETHVVDLSAGNFTANLPPVADGDGRIGFYIESTGGQLTLDPNASETIDGKAQVKIQRGHNTIENDGTEWRVIQKTGTISTRIDPAAITATEDGYNPADWGSVVTHLYISATGGAQTIEGFEENGFVDMQVVTVVNNGSENILIAHDTSTTAANRVLIEGGSTYTLGPNGVGLLLRDGTANRWRFYPVGGATAGDVVGPASATDNAIARFDLSTGKLIQNSGVTISDTNQMAGAVSITMPEQSTAPAPSANEGAFWVVDTAPSMPSFSDDLSRDWQLQQSIYMERTVPTGVNEYVEIGSMTQGTGVGFWMYVTSPQTGTATAIDAYLVTYTQAATSNSSNSGADYDILRPVYSGGGLAANYQGQVEIRKSGNNLWLRLRHNFTVLGTYTQQIRIVPIGPASFNFIQSTTVATATEPTTVYIGSASSTYPAIGGTGGTRFWKPVFMEERTAGPTTAAGYSAFWTKQHNGAGGGNRPYFTDDTGQEYPLQRTVVLERTIPGSTPGDTVEIGSFNSGDHPTTFSMTVQVGTSLTVDGVAHYRFAANANTASGAWQILRPTHSSHAIVGFFDYSPQIEVATDTSTVDLRVRGKGFAIATVARITITMDGDEDLNFTPSSTQATTTEPTAVSEANHLTQTLKVSNLGGVGTVSQMPIYFAERGADAGHVGGFGQFWVKDDSPNNPYFTDDAGNDLKLAGTTATPTTNAIAKWAGTTGRLLDTSVLIDGSNNLLAPATVLVNGTSITASRNLALEVQGTDASSTDAPSIGTMADDGYPGVVLAHYQHDDVGILFDAYFTDFNRSSDAGSNAAIFKFGDELLFDRSTGNAQGAVISWTDAMVINLSTGDTRFGGSTVRPISNDGTSLGLATHQWSDLFLASGGVINFSNGDVTVTHSPNTLTFAGAASGYLFDGAWVAPTSDGGANLGIGGSGGWNILYLASAGQIRFASGDVVISHATNVLNFTGATSGYVFDEEVRPQLNDGATLGTFSRRWSDLYLANGGVIEFGGPETNITGSNVGVMTLEAATDTIFESGGTEVGRWIEEGGLQVPQPNATINSAPANSGIYHTVKIDGGPTQPVYMDDSGCPEPMTSNWRFMVVHSDQLSLNGNSAQVAQGIVCYIVTNPSDTNTLFITDGTTTRSYEFDSGGGITGDVAVTIGASTSDSMTNLAAAITGDGSGLWDASHITGTTLINGAGVVLIQRRAQGASQNDRIYGTGFTAVRYISFAGEADYRRVGLGILYPLIPTSDPATKEFGPGRVAGDLLTGDTFVGALDQTQSILDEMPTPDAWRTVDFAGGGGGSGDVVGPASSTDNALVRFDLSTGKLIQNSGVTLDDSNNLTFPTLANIYWGGTSTYINGESAGDLQLFAADDIELHPQGVLQVSFSDGGGMLMRERATSLGPAAGFGAIMVRDDTPNVPVFTDDQSPNVSYNLLAWSPVKRPCLLATAGNVNLTGGSSPSAVDGVTTAVGNRILVWQQTTASQNGIYEVTTQGAGDTSTWARTGDFDNAADDHIEAGIEVYVQSGDTYSRTRFTLVGPTGTITIGSSNLEFISGGALVRSDTTQTQEQSGVTFPATQATASYTGTINVNDYDDVDVYLEVTSAAGITEATVFAESSGQASPASDEWATLKSDDQIAAGAVTLADYLAKEASPATNGWYHWNFPSRGAVMRFGVFADAVSGTFNLFYKRNVRKG
jgi:hypothetical protein